MEMIVLSDSNESVLSVNLNNKLKNVKRKSKIKPQVDDSDSSDFEFPEIQFYHAINEDNIVKSQTHTKSYLPTLNAYVSLYETDDKHTGSSKNLKQYDDKNSLYNSTNSSNTVKNSSKENRNIESQKKDKTVGKKSKTEPNLEKLKRQEHLIREKALKTIAIKKSKNTKPGECMKFMEVVLDKGIDNFTSLTNIIKTLTDANLQYSTKIEFISNSITWKRNIENNYINEANEICTVTNVEKVNQIMIIWNWDETVTKVADNSFCVSISNIKSSLANYKIILVIFGIEDYFAYREQEQNLNKNRTKKKAQEIYAKNNLQFKNFPKISRKQLETCLNEIQIITGCSSKLINNSQDLALMIYQCTKAIAETPHKLEKNQDLTNKFDWYVMGDNKNTVKVDKDGNGLKRLWQQQLCQFKLSSLEIAEAICSVYPSPTDLIEVDINI
ncbi:Crossover junction endonuclease EME1 [Eufriesea mexicana]|uniref:Crossover junction endonuclease EME1 n=1 Tax=Eufriesea mexicana TaxID=516756 RepID=A0A310S6K4_9HYME|nr:Crossover junction endonuclease EME1 [Eufriesea mexicana]